MTQTMEQIVFFFNGCEAGEDFSMGTTYKPNYCSQQMEAWGGGMTSRCLRKVAFGRIFSAVLAPEMEREEGCCET